MSGGRVTVARDAGAPAPDARLYGATRDERLRAALRRAGAIPCDLLVSGAAVVDARLLQWVKEEAPRAPFAVRGAGGRVALIAGGAPPAPDGATLDAIAAGAGVPVVDAPAGVVCFTAADGERPAYSAWRLSSKPGERWHLRFTRRWSFPLAAWLAERGVRPNTITWWSLWIAAAGAALVAFGGYAGGVLGAIVLFLAWVADCLDGAVSRLTFQASEAGARLDTWLGRVGYFLTLVAVAWAAYGARAAWREAYVALAVLLTGGLLAILLSLRAERMPADERPPALWPWRNRLDQVLHRDNTLALIAAALLGRIDLFVWLIALALHAAWVLDAAVLLARVGTARGPAKAA